MTGSVEPDACSGAGLRHDFGLALVGDVVTPTVWDEQGHRLIFMVTVPENAQAAFVVDDVNVTTV
jgi:hypothetical protein